MAMSRRRFLHVLGSSATLAATGCGRRERSLAVPYGRRPPEVVPGVPTFYASACSEGFRASAVLVKTREGRPIHLAGNDRHPRSGGKVEARTLAAVRDLYDPDRLRGPLIQGRPGSWVEARTLLAAALGEAGRSGRKVLLLTGAVNSPTRRALLTRLQEACPGLHHLAWEPAQGEGARAAFGVPVALELRLERAQTILSLGADCLNGEDPAAARAFTARRRPLEPGPALNRLWALEGPLTLTGSLADHRYPVRPSRLAALAFALARDLHLRHGLPLPRGAELPPGPYPREGIPAEVWDLLLGDLRRGGVVLCGPWLPPEAHVATHLLNTMLGATAARVRRTPPLATLAEVDAAVQAMAAGAYGVALLWQVNPAYAFPRRDAWKAAFAQVPTRAWLGQIPDESAAQCQLALPEPHWLEAWGDHDDGDVLALQQPALAPLYDTRQGEDLLLDLLGAGQDAQAFLKARWRREVYPAGSFVPFERFFQAAQHDGFVTRPDPAALPPPFPWASVAGAARRALGAGAPGLELVLRPGTQVHDGRYGNNGWLQELPDPVTQVTWGNPLALAVADAQALALADGDLVKVTVADQSITVPVVLQPGQASGVLALALGYGRLAGGHRARGVGVNAFPLLGPHLREGVTLAKARGHQELAATQRHHRMEGRDLARSLTPLGFALARQRRAHLPTLYPPTAPAGPKWGMAIDLSACLGCAACVVACQSENNIPVVGPLQVARGREMHWLRIDAYYEGADANPRVLRQPMLCQHCADAPCENVCPVNATNHSPDGLNQMIYNRCVGTRYCANNCPYKVRRFNFLDYAAKAEPQLLAHNPEVTVRPRGVMEKCTFCVQRIQEGQRQARTENRPPRDGDIVPACAAACPTEAIVFGDLTQPASRVARQSASPRGYRVLEELGARPAITYLARLRNPAGGGP